VPRRSGRKMAKQTARIEYTVEVRGSAVRKAREVTADEGVRFEKALDQAIEKLVNRGAFSVDVRYEGAVLQTVEDPS
jgi:hypothetical protein